MGVEVAGENDRRRQKRRRHSVYAGLNVVEQRSRLILWLWRMVQRADKHAVRPSTRNISNDIESSGRVQTSAFSLLLTYTATPPPRRPTRSRRNIAYPPTAKW